MMRRDNSGIAFIDLIFNVLIGFVFLFVIALILINPITKDEGPPVKAEFLITLEWPDESKADIDLWVQHNNNPGVGFSNREQQHIHLDRDDLGIKNDYYTVDGIRQTLLINKEVINLRGIVQGNYYIVAHAYSLRKENNIPIKIKIIKLNPYAEVYSKQEIVVHDRQIVRFHAFSIDNEGTVEEIFDHSLDIVPLEFKNFRGGW